MASFIGTVRKITTVTWIIQEGWEERPLQELGHFSCEEEGGVQQDSLLSYSLTEEEARILYVVISTKGLLK